MDVLYQNPTNFDTFLTTFVQGFWTYVNLRTPKKLSDPPSSVSREARSDCAISVGTDTQSYIALGSDLILIIASSLSLRMQKLQGSPCFVR